MDGNVYTYVYQRAIVVILSSYSAPQSAHTKKALHYFGYAFVVIVLPTVSQWGSQHCHLHCLNKVTDK